MDRQMDEWIDGGMDREIYGCMGRWMNGWMDEWADRSDYMHPQTCCFGIRISLR